MAAVYSFYIINKSGGLIFYKDYGSAGRMDTNDSLRLASLWHSMHAISQQLSPIPGCLGIELLEADNFVLHCFQSLTGVFGKKENLRNGCWNGSCDDDGGHGDMPCHGGTCSSRNCYLLWSSLLANKVLGKFYTSNSSNYRNKIRGGSP